MNAIPESEHTGELVPTGPTDLQDHSFAIFNTYQSVPPSLHTFDPTSRPSSGITSHLYGSLVEHPISYEGEFSD